MRGAGANLPPAALRNDSFDAPFSVHLEGSRTMTGGIGEAKVEFAVSSDGTRIAFEMQGSGEPVILIGGASNDRRSRIAGLPMAELLAHRFCVISYDRRGRGDSGHKEPYAAEREIEDLVALGTAAGGPVHLFGHSSGGALALLAATHGLPARSIAVYEPPYNMSEEDVAAGEAATSRLEALIAAGDLDAAQAHFMAMVGLPEQMIAGARQSAWWPGLVRIAWTLPHEHRILAAGAGTRVPVALIGKIAVPVLAMAGTKSPAWMQDAARLVADTAIRGTFKAVEGADHGVAPEIVAPLLAEFFGGIPSTA